MAYELKITVSAEKDLDTMRELSKTGKRLSSVRL